LPLEIMNSDAWLVVGYNNLGMICYSPARPFGILGTVSGAPNKPSLRASRVIRQFSH
jgi:hypothetical protein